MSKNINYIEVGQGIFFLPHGKTKPFLLHVISFSSSTFMDSENNKIAYNDLKTVASTGLVMDVIKNILFDNGIAEMEQGKLFTNSNLVNNYIDKNNIDLEAIIKSISKAKILLEPEVYEKLKLNIKEVL